jgi:hypothetical protein
LRGGGGGRGGGRQQNRGEEIKMTVGVDAASNSVIVSAPDYLFQEVKAFVERLDRSATETDETVRVVTLKRANSDLVQRSLTSVLGANSTVNKTAASTTTSGQSASGTRTSSPSGGPGAETRSSDQGQDAARQQMQFMQEIQRRMQEGGGDRGGGDRGSRGGDRGSRGGDSGRGGRGDSPRGGFGFPR